MNPTQSTHASTAAASHTPGPWLLYTDKFDPNMCAQVHIRGAAIADVYADGILPAGQGMANARLIAAAPDLLEALVAAKALLEDQGLFIYNPTGGLLGVTSAKIEDAIAKAAGRTE